jgi:hypothetical protein
MTKTQSKPALFQIERTFNDLVEGDIAEFLDGAEPPKIFLEIARPYSGPRPVNVKQLNRAYFTQFSSPEVIKKPARENVTHAELLARFGWSGAQFERAVVNGLALSKLNNSVFLGWLVRSVADDWRGCLLVEHWSRRRRLRNAPQACAVGTVEVHGHVGSKESRLRGRLTAGTTGRVHGP